MDNEMKRPAGLTVSSDDEYETVTVKISGVNASWMLRAIAIAKPGAPDAAAVTIDYSGEKITYDGAYEVYPQASKTAGGEISSGASISNLIRDTDTAIYVPFQTYGGRSAVPVGSRDAPGPAQRAHRPGYEI